MECHFAVTDCWLEACHHDDKMEINSVTSLSFNLKTIFLGFLLWYEILWFLRFWKSKYCKENKIDHRPVTCAEFFGCESFRFTNMCTQLICQLRIVFDISNQDFFFHTHCRYVWAKEESKMLKDQVSPQKFEMDATGSLKQETHSACALLLTHRLV